MLNLYKQKFHSCEFQFIALIGANLGSRILLPLSPNFTANDIFSPLPKICIISPLPNLEWITLSQTNQLFPLLGPEYSFLTALIGLLINSFESLRSTLVKRS